MLKVCWVASEGFGAFFESCIWSVLQHLYTSRHDRLRIQMLLPDLMEVVVLFPTYRFGTVLGFWCWWYGSGLSAAPVTSVNWVVLPTRRKCHNNTYGCANVLLRTLNKAQGP